MGGFEARIAEGTHPDGVTGNARGCVKAVGVQVWGNFDPGAHEVHVHREAEPGDEDLLDLAALTTILNGGTVYAVDREKVPGHAPLAAVFHY